MNFTGTRKSTLVELALTHLYTEATRNTEDPSDDTGLAYHTLEEALDELERLKRYPTVGDVCEALSKWIKEQGKYGSTFISVEYNKKTNTFWINKTYGEFHYLAMLDGKRQLDIANNHYPPHLIILIGRFYQSLKEEMK